MPLPNRWIVRVNQVLSTEYNAATLDLALSYLQEAMATALTQDKSVQVALVEVTPEGEVERASVSVPLPAARN